MISSELKDKVFQALDSSITVEQFEEWLVPRLPAFLASPNSADSNVVAAIELGLAEMSDNIRTRDEFLMLLKTAIQEEETILTIYPPSSLPEFTVTSSSSSQTMQPTLDFTTAVVHS